jgi:putative flippase GtrA
MVTVLTLKQKTIKQFFSSFFVNRQSLKQFIGYIGSGITATAVHYTLLICLVELWSINVIIASSIGFIGGAITGFSLNKQFVFCDPYAGKTACLKYLIMAGMGALLNILLLWVLTKFMHIYYLLAQIIVTISIVLCNFMCCKRWIFNKEKS